jgi:hypothetical protein
MKLPQFVRSVAFAAALALPTVGIQARTASAVPRDPCQDYLNQARLNIAIAQQWTALGQTCLNIGWIDQALDASTNAEVFQGFAEAYMTEYELECASAP